jgi:sugar phosphate isomerase/epimerase
MEDTQPVIGCHAWAFHECGYPAVVGEIADRGFAALDLPVGPPEATGTFPLASFAPRSGAVETLGSTLRDRAVRLSDVFLVLPTPVNAGPEHRQANVIAFDRAAQAAAHLGAPGITLSPGVADRDEPIGACIARSSAELARLRGIATGYGLELSIEPHIGSITDRPSTVLELVEQTPGLLVTLDYSHFIAAGVAQRDVERLHPLTRHLHVRQARPGILASPVASGTIDFDRAFEQLHADGYRGGVTIEYADSPWMAQDHVDVELETGAMAAVVRDRVTHYWGARDVA